MTDTPHRWPRRPFRFGVQASGAPDRAAWVELARRAEALGYATITMPDHFGDQLAPVPALMSAADATTRLRVGALVWDNDYKHPVVLAKELATIDVLSEGRLELGIGAGWMRTDYDAAGMVYDPAGVRVDRFVEGVEVLKGCFAPGAFSYAGTHYTISNHDGLPLPVQRPWPPILIGGGGKRVLSIAARHADIVGINGTMTAGAVGPEALESMTASAVDEKVAIVVERAGDRIAQIEMNVRAFFVSVTNDRDGTVQALSHGLKMPADAVLATPFALIGTPAQIVDDLRARRDKWGFSYVIVGAEDMEPFAPVVAELSGH
jgi:probable F420-dependent oxidoreductase